MRTLSGQVQSANGRVAELASALKDIIPAIEERTRDLRQQNGALAADVNAQLANIAWRRPCGRSRPSPRDPETSPSEARSTSSDQPYWTWIVSMIVCIAAFTNSVSGWRTMTCPSPS